MKRYWGHYWVIFDRAHFKVKLLRFKAGGELSRQYHNKRNELWLFLSGQGRLTIGSEIYNKDENYSGLWFNIPIGAIHKFIAWKTSWVLEVQYGEICTEEDIVRIHDKNV